MRYQFISFVLASSFLINASLHAQPAPQIQWQRTFGGSLSDAAYSITQTPDNGYIFVGFSNSNDGDFKDHHGTTATRDCIAGKLDSNGTLEWLHSLGGTGNDLSVCVSLATGGGYFIGATSNSNDGDVSGHHGSATTSDCWIIKLDEKGNKLWQRSFGGSLDDGVARIIPTSDNGFLFAARSNSNDGDVTGHHGSVSNSDIWIVRIDSLGKILWQKSYGGSGTDAPFGLSRTDDNDYVIAGYSNSNDGDVSGNHGGYDIWVLKINDTGKVIWENSFGSPKDDDMNSITLASDGGYIFGGSTYYSGGDVTAPHNGHHDEYDIWVVKLSRQGKIVWQRSLGGTGRDYEQDVAATSDGGCFVSGYSTSNDLDVSGHHGDTTNYDGWIAKLDSTGKLLWQKSIGGTKMDGASGIAITHDGGCAIACNSYSSDGDLNMNHGGEDCWIVKLLPSESKDEVTNDVPLYRSGFDIYPNPASSIIHLRIAKENISAESTVEITDLLGRSLIHIPLNGNTNSIAINVSQLVEGVYIVRIDGGSSGKQTSQLLHILK